MSGPTSRRSACGTMSPTNPISPVTLTIAPDDEGADEERASLEGAHESTSEVLRGLVSQREEVQPARVEEQDPRPRPRRRR